MKEIGLNGGGRFRIQAFDLVHDVPCYGFLITHPEIGKLLYVTDTEYVKYRFKDLNHILVEANYSEEVLKSDVVNYEHIKRGHMSIETSTCFIQANLSSSLRNICLIHLSGVNGDCVSFKSNVEQVVTSDTNVYVAERGLEIDLRK